MKYLFFITLLVSGFANAGVWEERALLERYLEQSKLLKSALIVKAEQSADPNARIRLNYAALHADLSKIETQLAHYLNEPMRQIVVGDADE